MLRSIKIPGINFIHLNRKRETSKLCENGHIHLQKVKYPFFFFFHFYSYVLHLFFTCAEFEVCSCSFV